MLEGIPADQIRELLIRFSLEAVFLVACLLALYFCCGLRQVFARLGGWRGRACIAFFVALTVVQLVDRWQYHFPARVSFYPLARFAMYQTGTASDHVDSYRFDGLFDGHYEEINLSERFRAVGLPSLNTRFRVISEKLISDDSDDVIWAEEQLRDYCRSVAHELRARGEELPAEIRFVVERHDVSRGHQDPPSQQLKVFRYSLS